MEKSKKKFHIFDKNLNFVFLTKIWTLFFTKKVQFFGCYNKIISRSEKCHTSLNSLFNFQSIDILTWKFLIFAIFRKKVMQPLQKMKKLVKK